MRQPPKNYWVVCANCKHEASYFKVFGTPPSSAVELERAIKGKLPKLKCTKCGEKGRAEIIDLSRNTLTQTRIVASISAGSHRFHKETCHTMRNVHPTEILEFRDQDGNPPRFNGARP